jgi:hypothetical protein
LIRSWRNRLPPVNKIPPEILSLIPDFWNDNYNDRDRDIITLTHVCQAWREVFTSRSSLWTDLNCKNKDKTRVYLERSKSLPINLSLDTRHRPPPYLPFFDVIPHAIGRLKSLSIEGTPENLQGITTHLSRPAPLLEKLSISGGRDREARHNPVLALTLFDGDLSSLRSLSLTSVRTELPWRNMVNLTSFNLCSMPPGEITVGQLLDFFESAPHLREVDIWVVTPTSGTQNGRLVSLARLEKINIIGGGPAFLLLDHLLIPVGAHMMIDTDLSSSPIEDRPPRFLNNLRNLSNFTSIDLWNNINFSGPNGEITMLPSDNTPLVLEALDQFDTSRVEYLRIGYGKSLSSGPPYRTLLPMRHLRTLELHGFENSHIFIHALHPGMSPSGLVVCPKLKKLWIELPEETLDLKDFVGMAAARASRGAKLKSVTIRQNSYVRTDVLELRKHVSRVNCGPEFDFEDYDGGTDEED